MGVREVRPEMEHVARRVRAEEYWGIMREMRRYRLNVMGFAVVVAVAAIVLGLTLGIQFSMLMPVRARLLVHRLHAQVAAEVAAPVAEPSHLEAAS